MSFRVAWVCTSVGVGLLLAAALNVGNQAIRAAIAEPVEVARVPDGGIQPQVVVDARGVVHLVYFKGDPGRGDLFYVRAEKARTFSAPIRVNSEPASAIATGNVRGAHLAVATRGRVHVAWNGSDRAVPRAPGGATPLLYARMNRDGTGFEPQRNLVRSAVGLDGGGAIAADEPGRVYVAWHANEPGSVDESSRRVWLAVSDDDGERFQPERPISASATGACGCCGMSALTGPGSLFMLYRSARELVHRDTYLLASGDRGATFSADLLDEWSVGACPLSTFALARSGTGVLAAWETGGQVRFVRVDAARRRSPVTEAPGDARTRKHPAIVQNDGGQILLVWTEGMSWSRGGSVKWQLFGATGAPIGEQGGAPGVPAWSLVAVYAAGDRFVVVY